MEKLNLTIPEAAGLSGCSRTRIYAALRHGELEARKAGRRTMIPKEALGAWIDSWPAYASANRRKVGRR